MNFDIVFGIFDFFLGLLILLKFLFVDHPTIGLLIIVSALLRGKRR